MHTYIHSNKNPYKQNYSSSPFLSARLSFLLASPFCSNSSPVVCISKIPSYSVRQNTIGRYVAVMVKIWGWAELTQMLGASVCYPEMHGPSSLIPLPHSRSWWRWRAILELTYLSKWILNLERDICIWVKIVWSVMKRRVVVVDLGVRGWNKCLVSLPKDYLFNIVCPFFPWWVARRDLTTSENWR